MSPGAWVYEVDAPDMWEVYRGRYVSTSALSGGAGIFSVAGPATEAWLPAHPCWDRTLMPVGPTAGAYVEVRSPTRSTHLPEADLEVLAACPSPSLS